MLIVPPGWENGWWNNGYDDADWRQALMPRWYCYGKWYNGTKPSICTEARQYFNNNWDSYYNHRGELDTEQGRIHGRISCVLLGRGSGLSHSAASLYLSLGVNWPKLKRIQVSN